MLVGHKARAAQWARTDEIVVDRAGGRRHAYGVRRPRRNPKSSLASDDKAAAIDLGSVVPASPTVLSLTLLTTYPKT